MHERDGVDDGEDGRPCYQHSHPDESIVEEKQNRILTDEDTNAGQSPQDEIANRRRETDFQYPRIMPREPIHNEQWNGECIWYGEPNQ